MDKYIDDKVKKELKAPKLKDYIPATLGGFGTGAALGAGAYAGLADEIDPDTLMMIGTGTGLTGATMGANAVKTEYEIEKNIYLNKLAQSRMDAIEKANQEKLLYNQPTEYELQYYMPKTPEEREAALGQLKAAAENSYRAIQNIPKLQIKKG